VVFARIAARLSLPIVLVIGLIMTTAAPVSASANLSELDLVLETARNQLGDQYVHYARGPEKFDCVGLAWYVFKQNDLQSHIGGYRGVKAYYNWFKERGLVATSEPRLGDLIIWGKFQHVGIYVGDGLAISALNPKHGVKVHPVKGWLGIKFRYYLRTQLSD
jgi:cell wall-associated NlpC family hydrolase